jgi:hypothetical protein
MAGPILFFLPGAALVMYIRDRHEDNLLALEIVALSIGTSLLLTLLAGLLLAELSIYTLTRLAILLTFLTVLFASLWLVRRRGSRPRAQAAFRHGWFQIGVLLVMAFASVLFIGRWEAVLTEADVSPYLLEGVNIANHGQVFLHNDTLPKLTKDEAGVLYGPRAVRGQQEYLAGFGIHDQKAGTVNTRYFPLFSVLIAIAYRLLGLKWMLTLMNPCVALVSLLIIILLVRRLLDPKTAVLTGLVLSIVPLSIWFARFPIPEMFTQLFVFLGLFFLVLYYPRGNGIAGLLAALAFGLTFTARFELYSILAPLLAVLVFFIIDSITKRRSLSHLLWFVLPFGPLLAHSLISQKHFSGSYFAGVSSYNIPRYLKSPIVKGPAVVLIAIVLVGLVLLVSKKTRGYLNRSILFLKRQWRYIVATLVALVSLYGYLIRPIMARGRLALPAVSNYGSRQPQTLVRMSWYITHIGVVLFILGLVLFILYGLKTKTVPLFFICGFFAALFFWNMSCNPLHLWFLRRLVPAVLPFMAIMIGYAVVKTPGLFKRKHARSLAMALVAASLAVVLFFAGQYTLFLYPLVQYDGALKSMNDINRLIGGPGTAAVFYGRYSMVYYTDIMRYMYGIDAVPLVGAAGNPATFDNIFRKLAANGDRVYLVGYGDRVPVAVSNLYLRPVGSVPVSFKVLVQEYDVTPKKFVPFNFNLIVYQVTAKPPAEKYSVEVGGADTLSIIDGFYPSEQGAYRWTGGTARFKMPNVETKDKLSLDLDLALMSRPLAPGQSVPVVVYAQNKPIGTLSLDNNTWEPYHLSFDKASLPDPKAKEIDFRIEVPTWKPATQLGKQSNDVRQLGVAVRSITLRPVP